MHQTMNQLIISYSPITDCTCQKQVIWNSLYCILYYKIEAFSALSEMTVVINYGLDTTMNTKVANVITLH